MWSVHKTQFKENEMSFHRRNEFDSIYYYIIWSKKKYTKTITKIELRNDWGWNQIGNDGY